MPKTRRPGIATILLELRRELKAKGIRVADLARQTEVAEPTIWRWLRGDGLTLDRLDEICAIADLDMRDLVARGDDQQESFTLAQERVLAADRGLALVFFAILHGAQRQDLEAPSRGRIRSKMRRAVRWRRGGPLSMAFERTVKPLFMSLDFGSPEALYMSDMVSLSEAGRARVHALFEALRDDIHVIGEQEQAARLEGREWSGVLMMVRPFDI
jgi:transcriptional regulator with XRE-family HTH domain